MNFSKKVNELLSGQGLSPHKFEQGITSDSLQAFTKRLSNVMEKYQRTFEPSDSQDVSKNPQVLKAIGDITRFYELMSDDSHADMKAVKTACTDYCASLGALADHDEAVVIITDSFAGQWKQDSGRDVIEALLKLTRCLLFPKYFQKGGKDIQKWKYVQAKPVDYDDVMQLNQDIPFDASNSENDEGDSAMERTKSNQVQGTQSDSEPKDVAHLLAFMASIFGLTALAIVYVPGVVLAPVWLSSCLINTIILTAGAVCSYSKHISLEGMSPYALQVFTMATATMLLTMIMSPGLTMLIAFSKCMMFMSACAFADTDNPRYAGPILFASVLLCVPSILAIIMPSIAGMVTTMLASWPVLQTLIAVAPSAVTIMGAKIVADKIMLSHQSNGLAYLLYASAALQAVGVASSTWFLMSSLLPVTTAFMVTAILTVTLVKIVDNFSGQDANNDFEIFQINRSQSAGRLEGGLGVPSSNIGLNGDVTGDPLEKSSSSGVGDSEIMPHAGVANPLP